MASAAASRVRASAGYTVAVGGTEREVVMIDLDTVARGTGSARVELRAGGEPGRALAGRGWAGYGTARVDGPAAPASP